MPKVDTTRNYYADLQVTPSASAEDIKKQYRKLAMQWHPDRNRGREEEASKKFQVIQAAFEILTDSTLKRQVDEARNKTGSRFPTSSGVRGNPWANAGSEFPPPPKRPGANARAGTGTGTGTGAGTGTGTQPRPTPGASRYSNWGSGTSRGSRTSQQSDPSSAKAHYDAWNNMRAHSTSNTQRKPPPTPGRPPTSATRDSKTSDSEGVPRTASQKQKAEASFGNSTRRTGFTPRSPGLGDEPPVTNNNYFTTRTRPNIFPEESAGTARQNHRASAAPDPLAQFRETFMDGRHSSPYATPGGEKTSLRGDGLGRARSTREPDRNSSRDDSDSYFPRQRSNSTPRSSSNDGGSEDSTKANTGVKPENRRTNMNSSTSTKFGDRYRPKSAESVHQTPPKHTGHLPKTAGGSPTAAFSAGSQPPGASNKYALKPCLIMKENPTIALVSGKLQSTNEAARAAASLYCGGPSSGAFISTESNLLPIEQVLKKDMDRLIRQKQEFESRQNSHGGQQGGSDRLASKKYNNISSETNTAYSFGFTTDPSTPEKRFASSSADNISTKFAEEHPGAWEFTAGGPPSEDNAVPYNFRSRSGSRLGRRSPHKSNRKPVPSRPGASETASASHGEPESTNASGFSAAQWGEKIGSEHFVPQLSTSAAASPTRRSNSRKNTKPIKITRGGSAGIVDEDDESPTETSGWQDVPPSGAQSPMAMDIDTPPVEKNASSPQPAHANDARKIPVEPTRPDWRAGDANGQPPPMPPRPTLTADTSADAASQSKSAPTTANPFAAQTGGSEDSEEFRATFSDFKKVEPFTDPKPTGLQSFADLKTTLPFESRASAQLPLDKVQSVPPLDFPTTPVAPRLPPSMAVPGLRPSNAQWRKYAQDFYNYMEKWEVFNDKVLTHFSTRQAEITKRHQQFGRAWLEGVHGVDGASLYQAELDQDHDVRKQWMRACDEHQNRMREFVAFRDRAK